VKARDLDDRAPIEPDDALLASVHARSRSFRKRRSAQRLASVTTGIVVIALATGIAWTRVDTNNGRDGSPVPLATTTTTPLLLTQAAIWGEWRPVSISGYDGPLTTPTGNPEPRLTFDGRDRWGGSDGCNQKGGTYRLDGNGVDLLTFESTAIGCTSSTPDFEPLLGAARIELRDDHLLFLTADGQEIARFAHAGVTARIELPSTTMIAGSTMSGRVVVENNTGHEIAAKGCLSVFQVMLGNAAIHPDPAWYDCVQELPIPVGESSYPVTVTAAYSGCDTTGANGVQKCLPSGGVPPLPPGDYETRFFQSSPVVFGAPPIDVTVEPQPTS